MDNGTNLNSPLLKKFIICVNKAEYSFINSTLAIEKVFSSNFSDFYFISKKYIKIESDKYYVVKNLGTSEQSIYDIVKIKIKI
jgi:hypothetical protein